MLCAIWVACSHGGYPPLTVNLDTSNQLQWFINGIYTSIFCGPAAVIVFFLISGFCIHYPYKNSWSKETIIPFIIARLTRITLPIIIVAVIIEILGINASIFYLLVGWSIVCEIVYYIIYPFLRLLIKNKKGWQKLLLLSYIPTILAFWFFPLKLVNYPGVGFYYVISLGFPCWMLGLLLCYSIDNNNQKNSPSKKNLVFHRILIFFLAFATHVLALQEVLGHPFTLNLFAIAAFFWLRKEIAFYHDRPTNNFMDNLGKASYSIYLMHGIPAFIISLLTTELEHSSKFFIYWLILAILTSAFYFLVEKPTHNLSRKLFSHFLLKKASSSHCSDE